MVIRRIHSPSPYEPKIGYARAVVAGDFIFVSGTTGLDPNGPDVQPVTAQCALALDRVEAALAETGASLADVVRVQYILPDRTLFEDCWPTLRARFGENPPTATMIEAGLIDPAMLFEVEVTAYKPAGLYGASTFR
ncbi:MAG: RidA family protein [Pseudomonadota bacterium]